MATSDQVRDLDLYGFYRGRVVNNVDLTGEGRVGLFIPALVTEMPNFLEKPAPTVAVMAEPVFENQSELQVSSVIREDNYIWARPAAWLVENGTDGENAGGSYRVPNNGTMVFCFFEGGDPNRPYWMPFSPTVAGDVIAGRELGKGINLSSTTANWRDPARRVNVHVLAEHDNGNVILIDNNDDSNSFVVRWANGHTFSIGHAAESGIVLQTQKGHLVQMDENSGEIRVRTQTGKSSAVLSDSGDVTITNTGKTTVKSGGEMLLQSSVKVTIKAPAIKMSG